MPLKVFHIPYNTPSSKNSKIWTGKFLVNSKVTTRWLDLVNEYFIDNQQEFRIEVEELPLPLFIHMTFIRDSKRRFDFNNASQIIMDNMKLYGWIEDDSTDQVVPVYGKPEYIKFKKDEIRDRAGVLIRVLKKPPQYDI